MSEDDNAIRLTVPMSDTRTLDWLHEIQTPILQFIRRDGKLVLQQKWQINTPMNQRYEWRDVPIGEEDNNGQ